MKIKILTIAGILFLAGCSDGLVQDKSFDSRLAGTWKAEKEAWEVVITENGRIESAIHPLGEALVKPNKTTYIKMKEGSKSSYKGGDFSLKYNPEYMELEVSIIVDKIHIKFGKDEIIGSTDTTITGFISDDYTVWDTNIIEIFDYGERFPQSEEDISPRHLIFRKISN